MKLDEEKEIIYSMMREIISERRELSKQYYDLKAKLDEITENKQEEETNDCLAGRIKHDVKERPTAFLKKRQHYPFERIAGYVVEILKESDNPQSNKEIFDKLVSEYGITILYSNFSNNILPRIQDSSQFSIVKVGRGYWQYKPKGK